MLPDALATAIREACGRALLRDARPEAVIDGILRLRDAIRSGEVGL